MNMHDIVVDNFESHLSGEAPQAFHDHLADCASCREQVTALADLSGFMQTLQAPADYMPESPLGFYNKVTYRIVETEQKGLWRLFSPGAVFFRRIAFASLLLLATLGGFLVTHEHSETEADGASIIAQHDVTVDHPASEDRDRLLVTLADYHE